jgi:hypothetical protein
MENNMKLTENDRKLFKEIQKKHKLRNEGLFSTFFKSALRKYIEKDKGIQDALKDADKDLDRVAQWAKEQEAKGLEVPEYLKRYLPR